MRLWCALVCGALALGSWAQSPARAVQAVKKALPVLQATNKVWFEKAPCTSCHHQSVPIIAQVVARDNGIKVDEKTLAAHYKESTNRRGMMAEAMYELAGAINGNSGHGYQVLSQIAMRRPADQYTDALEYFLVAQQSADGRWVSTSHRPPIEDSPVTVTATSVRGLQVFGKSPEAKAALRRGLAFLTKVKTKDAEERAFRLLGLVWGGADAATIKSARRAVLDDQKKDGGWSQVADRPSDAYATGLSAVALRVSGWAARSQAIRRAAGWLIDHQEKDGTWHVKTRRVVEGLPYFETGFPYGVDQFISTAGSAWATAALAVYGTDGDVDALTTTKVGKRTEPAVTFSADKHLNRLFRAVVLGKASDVTSALKAGAKPNGVAFGQLTPLMLAVGDPAKVKLLLDAGADPNAVSKRDTTAMLLAARSFGAKESMRLLLAAKADPFKGRDDNLDRPLNFAAQTFDVERLRILVDHGVTPTGADASAIFDAANIGDMAAFEYLLSKGGDPALENKQYGGNLVNDMVVNRDPIMLARILKEGANPNAIDKEGWSALQVAAQGDPGDAKIVAMLLAAGADPAYSTKDKPVAIELAKRWGNTASVDILARLQR